MFHVRQDSSAPNDGTCWLCGRQNCLEGTTSAASVLIGHTSPVRGISGFSTPTLGGKATYTHPYLTLPMPSHFWWWRGLLPTT